MPEVLHPAHRSGKKLARIAIEGFDVERLTHMRLIRDGHYRASLHVRQSFRHRTVHFVLTSSAVISSRKRLAHAFKRARSPCSRCFSARVSASFAAARSPRDKYTSLSHK